MFRLFHLVAVLAIVPASASEFGDFTPGAGLELDSRYVSEARGSSTRIRVITTARNTSNETVRACFGFGYSGGYELGAASVDKLEVLTERAREEGVHVCRPYPIFAIADEFFGVEPFACEPRTIASGDAVVDTLDLSVYMPSYTEWPGAIRVHSTLVYGESGSMWEDLFYDRESAVEVVIPVP